MNKSDLMKKYPEIVSLREFSTTEEVNEYYKDGGEVWVTRTAYDLIPVGTIIHVNFSEIYLYDGECIDLINSYLFTANPPVDYRFLSDLANLDQNLPCGIFTTEQGAIDYAQAVIDAYNHDADWKQMSQARTKKFDELFASQSLLDISLERL